MRRILSLIVATVVAGGSANAQQRRIAGPGGGGVELPKIPADPSHPFVGALIGRLALDDTIPIAIVIQIADGKYTGATVWPNGARAPHLSSVQTGNVLAWQQANSGGGMWHYVMKRTTGDTLVGTMTLRDAPNFPPRLPMGSLVLVRDPQ
ncbi:MAG: hypothetical protein ACREPM_05350 [Gemmatimonadaceae bacterium]